MKIIRKPNGDKTFIVEPLDVLVFTGAVVLASFIQAAVFKLLFNL